MIAPKWRYAAGALTILALLHVSFLTVFRSSSSGLPSMTSNEATAEYAPVVPTHDDLRLLSEANDEKLTSRRRANAVFVVLARNSDLFQWLESMRQMEDRFNHWARYDYVFLNDEEFTDEFKRRTQSLTKGKCQYGLIEHDHWNQPDWIDEEKATTARVKMVEAGIIYAGSVPYRNMCRFNSGFFFKHPLLAQYDYYWRIEPDVRFFCDLSYDPFLLMQDTGKVYGFTISLYEFIETIPTLWDETMKFIKEHPEYVAPDNAMEFVSDNGGESYNLCHFWSNFEIADLRFWRSQAYTDYFNHLESTGGFYYERWGDAPVHSLAATLFANKSQLHFFDDIGYRHSPFQHCPQGPSHEKNRCICNPSDNFDFEGYSCTRRYVNMPPPKEL